MTDAETIAMLDARWQALSADLLNGFVIEPNGFITDYERLEWIRVRPEAQLLYVAAKTHAVAQSEGVTAAMLWKLSHS